MILKMRYPKGKREKGLNQIKNKDNINSRKGWNRVKMLL